MMVPPTGLGWIIVDALDTLMLMNLTTQLKHAREWISTTLTYELDHDVNTFETTIRMLGGFLTAHYLQTEFPNMCPVDLGSGGEDLYLEKATDLAERVIGAFDSPSGIPWSSVNLKTMQGIKSHADGGAASLAEATTVQLEMKYLAKLTGEKNYWDKVEKVMEVVDASGEPDGLKGLFIHPETGQFSSNNIRLGSRGDSFYGMFDNHR
jgi:mannosyl-oligosaccharide alpha-1,2-mannosidase